MSLQMPNTTAAEAPSPALEIAPESATTTPAPPPQQTGPVPSPSTPLRVQVPAATTEHLTAGGAELENLSDVELRDKILTCDRQAVELANTARSVVKMGLERVIEAGLALVIARKRCPYGTWEKWLDVNLPDLERSRIARYLNVGERISHVRNLNLDEIKTIRQLYLVLGIIKEAKKPPRAINDAPTLTASDFIARLHGLGEFLAASVEAFSFDDESAVMISALSTEIDRLMVIISRLQSRIEKRALEPDTHKSDLDAGVLLTENTGAGRAEHPVVIDVDIALTAAERTVVPSSNAATAVTDRNGSEAHSGLTGHDASSGRSNDRRQIPAVCQGNDQAWEPRSRNDRARTKKASGSNIERASEPEQQPRASLPTIVHGIQGRKRFDCLFIEVGDALTLQDLKDLHLNVHFEANTILVVRCPTDRRADTIEAAKAWQVSLHGEVKIIGNLSSGRSTSQVRAEDIVLLFAQGFSKERECGTIPKNLEVAISHGNTWIQEVLPLVSSGSRQKLGKGHRPKPLKHPAYLSEQGLLDLLTIRRTAKRARSRKQNESSHGE